MCKCNLLVVQASFGTASWSLGNASSLTIVAGDIRFCPLHYTQLVMQVVTLAARAIITSGE